MQACPICTSTATRKLLDWGKYTVMHCNTCDLIYSAPLPTESALNSYYQGFMFRKPSTKEIPAQLRTRKKELSKLLELSEHNGELSARKFLDFGGGTGIVYKAARDLGMNAFYHDIDEEAARFTRQKFGLTDDKNVDDIKTCTEQFDFIFTDNVIEHVKDPVAFTETLVDQLHHHGVLLIKTPHARNTATLLNPWLSMRGYLFRATMYNTLPAAIRGYFKRFWHCDPPRHLYSFSAESFRCLMKRLPQQKLAYEILFYGAPIFSNTLSKVFFTKDKRLTPGRSILIRLVSWPIIPLEVVLQLLKWLLLKAKILTPEGIILKIRKIG